MTVVARTRAPWQRSRESEEQTTGPDGRCQFAPPPLEPLEYATVQLAIQAPETGEPFAPTGWSGPFTNDEIRVVVERGVIVSGTVRLDSGEPLSEDARLNLTWETEDGRMGTGRYEIENGAFQTDKPIFGRLTAAGLGRKGLPFLSIDKDDLSMFRFESGRPPGPVDLVFEVGCSCEARFVDADTGEPIVGAQVSYYGKGDKTTDEDGSFRTLSHVTAGTSTRKTRSTWRERRSLPSGTR